MAKSFFFPCIQPNGILITALVEIDDDELRVMVQRAIKNKSRKCKDGALTVRIDR